MIRRIRNALAHGNVKVLIPENIAREDMFKSVCIEFQDVNPRVPSDTFDVTLSLIEIFQFIKKFQGFIHKYVRNKYKISSGS
ncbi:MAG: HEPN family nuclease [Candidatus Bathyarchaeia archaeon]